MTLDGTEDAQPLTPLKVLQSVWSQVAPHPSIEDLRGFAAAGWTPSDVLRLGVLARWADDEQTAVARRLRSTRLIAQAMAESARPLFWQRLPPAEALGWLGLLAAAPTDTWLDTVLAVLAADHSLTFLGREAETTVAAWTAALPAPLRLLGPVAWAAGLTPDEVRDPTRHPDLTAETLQAMAALRGWRMPPLL